MLSYILLIVIKLFHTRNIATASLKNERAYSAYLSGPKTFNVIDKDHRRASVDGVIHHDELQLALKDNSKPSHTEQTSAGISTIMA